MSFVGVFGGDWRTPDSTLVQRSRFLSRFRPNRRAAALGVFVASFCLSSTVIFGAARFLGDLLSSQWALNLRMLLLAGLLLVVAGIDAFYTIHLNRIYTLSCKRQTIRTLPGGRWWLAPLVWGVDTGSAVTTYRTSGLPWILLGAGVLSLTGWWLGVLYGLGFILPVALMSLRGESQSSRNLQFVSNRIRVIGKYSIVISLLIAGGLIAVGSISA